MRRREALKASPIGYATRVDEAGQAWFATGRQMFIQTAGTMKPASWPAHTADIETWEPVMPEIPDVAAEPVTPSPAPGPVAPVPSVQPPPPEKERHKEKRRARKTR